MLMNQKPRNIERKLSSMFKIKVMFKLLLAIALVFIAGTMYIHSFPTSVLDKLMHARTVLSVTAKDAKAMDEALFTMQRWTKRTEPGERYPRVQKFEIFEVSKETIIIVDPETGVQQTLYWAKRPDGKKFGPDERWVEKVRDDELYYALKVGEESIQGTGMA